MLYVFPASWTFNGAGTKPNEVLSALDKAFVDGAKMYPNTVGTTSNAIELQMNAKPVPRGLSGRPEKRTCIALPLQRMADMH